MNAIDKLRNRPTDELVQLFKRVGDGNSEEAVAVKNILATRNRRFPNLDQTRPTAIFGKESPISHADSNASVKLSQQGKLHIRFPERGYIRCGRSKFESRKDLFTYINSIFGVELTGDSPSLRVRRSGKYQRLAANGQPAFTFGDPITDLITDEHGWITIGNETYCLMSHEIASPKSRSGGISTIDRSLEGQTVLRQQLAEATSEDGKLALLECNTDRIVIASTNPSTRYFYDTSDPDRNMRFRSWKRDRLIYLSIGTDIETSKSNFSYAQIDSEYAVPVVDNYPAACAIGSIDSDSDSNDDYVDEYEKYWFSYPKAISVRSFCQATWNGGFFSGTVSKGDCILYL